MSKMKLEKLQVWFQNRRMKDKRQKMGGVPWPLMSSQIAYMLAPAFQCDFWSRANSLYTNPLVESISSLNLTFHQIF